MMDNYKHALLTQMGLIFEYEILELLVHLETVTAGTYRYFSD
jgi:hypothetical protein